MRGFLEAILAATLVLPLAVGLPAPADDPLENGDFELGVHAPAARDALTGTPADACVGLGHQVFYGYETLLGTATGGPFAEPDPSEADPQQAAANATDRPAATALDLAGYRHCVYGSDTGTDVVWFQPVDHTDKAAFWSVHPRIPSADFGHDHDGDPADREVRFPSDASLSNLNMWQSYVSQPGVYTANFDEFRFDVEAGIVPDSARFQLVLSATPLERQTPYLAGYLDCVLQLTDLSPDADGTVRVGPLEGTLTLDDDSGPDSEADCQDAAAIYNDPTSTDAERRDALGRLRIVQVNFRNFNLGAGSVTIDDVALPGTTTVADEASHGNADVDPDAGTGGV